MRRILSFAFSMSNIVANEDVLKRRTDGFLNVIGGTINSERREKSIDIVQKFNYVTFEIMGEMSFGDAWDMRLEAQPGQSLSDSSQLPELRLTFPENTVITGPM